MEFFQKDDLLFRRASPANPSKRFCAAFIDYLLLFFMGIGFFYASYALTVSSSDYKNYHSQAEEEISYYNAKIQETHLVSFEGDGSTRVGNEALILKLAAREIVLTYDKLVASSEEEGFSKPEKAFLEAENEEASFSSDNIAYFYTVYVPSHNEGNDLMSFSVSPKKYFVALHKSGFSTASADQYFLYNGEEDLPYLYKSYAQHLNAYLYEGGKDETGKGVYDSFYEVYSSLFENAEKVFLQGKSYQATHYPIYVEAHLKEAMLIADDVLYAALLAFLPYFLIQFLLCSGRSVGRYLLGIGFVKENGGFLSFWDLLKRSPFELLFSLLTCFLLMALPPFGFDFTCLYLPLFSLGGFEPSLGVMSLIALLFLAIDFLFALFTHEKRSLVDILSGTRLVDKRHLDEEDLDGPEVLPS